MTLDTVTARYMRPIAVVGRDMTLQCSTAGCILASDWAAITKRVSSCSSACEKDSSLLGLTAMQIAFAPKQAMV